MEDQEIIREFVLESNENLGRLDQEIVELEERPEDADLLASVFRTMHTLKGTCGFLGYGTMESVSHHAENILSQIRSGTRALTPELVTLILESVDMIRRELASVETNGTETGNRYEDLLHKLELAEKNEPGTAPSAAVPEEETGQANTEAPTQSAVSPRTDSDSETGAMAPAEADTPGAAAPEKQSETAFASTSSSGKSAPEPKTREASPSANSALAPTASRSAEPPRSASAGDEEDESVSAQSKSKSVQDSAIRVDVQLLDKLMNLVGELVLARNQILQFTGSQDDAALSATSQRLDLITTELQEGVMKTRMQPIGMIWNKLPRVVRDLASICGKQIRIEMDGAETELDKTIIEAIKDPITHIVRNSCDHGIEDPGRRVAAGKQPQGKLFLRAFHEGGHVNIEIGDDGAGIDPAKVGQRAIERGILTADALSRMGEREIVQLIFAPGFSTAETVSSISGRGVGMDVVRTNIERIGGNVDVDTAPGQGTTVKLKIPLTLAIIPGLLVTDQDERFVIPQASLLELIRLERDQVEKQIEWIHSTPVYRRRGKLLPLAFLGEVLHANSADPGGARATKREVGGGNGKAVNIVVLQADTRQFGLVVDGISDTQEIVVKPLGNQLKGLVCYAGATIMGDGQVALILDVSGVCQLSGILSRVGPEDELNEQADHSMGEMQSFLLFAAGDHDRLAVPLGLVARLEEFPREQIERAAGRLVVQYRGQILPVASLASILDGAPADPGSFPETVKVVVFSQGDRQLGVLVDQILDIVEGDLRSRRSTSRPGILASIVLSGRITDLIDLKQILRSEDEGWFERSAGSTAPPRPVLLAEPEAFRRNLIRISLQLAGYRVVETNTLPEMLRSIDTGFSGLCLVSPDLAPHQGKSLAEWIAEIRTRADVRFVALQSRQGESTLGPDTVDAIEDAFDHAGMLRSIRQLSSATAERGEATLRESSRV